MNVERLLNALKEQIKTDMPFERYKLIRDTINALEQLSQENKTLRNTLQRIKEGGETDG